MSATDLQRGNDRTFTEHALGACELFGGWPAGPLATLADAARVERFGRRIQVLATEPERRVVFVVASGCVEVSRFTDDGKRFLLTLLGPGQVTRLVQLLGREPVPYNFYAHEGTALVHLPVDSLQAVLDANPALWKQVAQLLLGRQRDYMGMLFDHAMGSQQRRVSATLASMSRLSGAREEDGRTLRLRLSQDDLGAMLGLSRQSVSKELGALQRAGIVAADYSRITIHDVKALCALAGQTDKLPHLAWP